VRKKNTPKIEKNQKKYKKKILKKEKIKKIKKNIYSTEYIHTNNRCHGV
jgi:hypothetical protein